MGNKAAAKAIPLGKVAYTWSQLDGGKEGQGHSYYPKDTAQPVGEWLRALDTRLESRGGATPHDVVEAARDKKSPAHVFFTWDDITAAQRWRIEQAKHLMRSIKIEYVSYPEMPPVRFLMNVRDPEQGPRTAVDRGIYVPIDRAMSDEGMRDEILGKAYREIQIWAARYRQLVEVSQLPEFAALVAAIDAVGKQLKLTMERVGVGVEAAAP